MSGFRKVVSFIAGVSFLVGGVAAASAADKSKDEAAIRAINPAWAKAYNAADGKGVSALYAQDAVLLPPGAPAANGIAAIQAFFAKDVAESAKAGVTLSLAPKSDVGVSGDLGWESGAYTVKAKSGAVVEAGKYLAVYKKSGGKWHMIRDTWNADTAPAPAAAAPAGVTPAVMAPAMAPAAPAKK